MDQLREIIALSNRVASLEANMPSAPVPMPESPGLADALFHVDQHAQELKALKEELNALSKRIQKPVDIASIRTELARCVKLPAGENINSTLTEVLVGVMQPILAKQKKLEQKVDATLTQALKASEEASRACKVSVKMAADRLEQLALAYSTE